MVHNQLAAVGNRQQERECSVDNPSFTDKPSTGKTLSAERVLHGEMENTEGNK